MLTCRGLCAPCDYVSSVQVHLCNSSEMFLLGAEVGRIGDDVVYGSIEGAVEKGHKCRMVQCIRICSVGLSLRAV